MIQGTFLDQLFSRSQVAGCVVVVGGALLHVSEFVLCRLAEAISFLLLFWPRLSPWDASVLAHR
jgi:hypothetical protein